MQSQYNLIPLLSEERKRALFDGETVNFKLEYIYDKSNEREKRHQTAQIATYITYEMGAKIINGSLTETTQKALTLIDIYNRLPQATVWNGSRNGINPIQSFFIFKVALDHLKAEEIYKTFQTLWADHGKTTGHSIFILPNKSKLFSDQALYEFMYNYIYCNRETFSSFEFRPDTFTSLYDSDTYMQGCGSIFGADIKIQPVIKSLMNKEGVDYNVLGESLSRLVVDSEKKETPKLLGEHARLLPAPIVDGNEKQQKEIEKKLAPTGM